MVGSNFACNKIFAIKDVVVVLPCEPVTMIFFLKETILDNISARSKIGSFFFPASLSSGLLFFIAEDLTIIVESEIFDLLCPKKILIPIFYSIFLSYSFFFLSHYFLF